MVPEYMAVEAWMLLGAVCVVGSIGLRMCRAMLHAQTALDLKRAAALSMLKPGSSYRLSSHQRAAVFALLSECGEPLASSTPPGRSRGSQRQALHERLPV